MWESGEGGPRDLRRQKAWGNQRQAAGSGAGNKVGGLKCPEGNSSLYPTALRSQGKDPNHRTIQGGGALHKAPWSFS